MKASAASRSRVAATNSFFLISSTCFMVGKILALVYNSKLKSQLIQLTSILFKIRKDIFKVIFMLRLVNKKVLLKN